MCSDASVWRRTGATSSTSVRHTCHPPCVMMCHSAARHDPCSPACARRWRCRTGRTLCIQAVGRCCSLLLCVKASPLDVYTKPHGLLVNKRLPKQGSKGAGGINPLHRCSSSAESSEGGAPPPAIQAACHVKSLPKSFQNPSKMYQTRRLNGPTSRSGGDLGGS